MVYVAPDGQQTKEMLIVKQVQVNGPVEFAGANFVYPALHTQTPFTRLASIGQAAAQVIGMMVSIT